jgi:hypothetical protein
VVAAGEMGNEGVEAEGEGQSREVENDGKERDSAARGRFQQRLCSICLDEFAVTPAVAALPCGHVFHAGCVRGWLAAHDNACPLCRAKAPRGFGVDSAAAAAAAVSGGGGKAEGKAGSSRPEWGVTFRQRLEFLLQRLQERHPEFRGGRRGWTPRDVARYVAFAPARAGCRVGGEEIPREVWE